MTKIPTGTEPQSHHQQFRSVHGVTFNSISVPGWRKSAASTRKTSAPFKAWEEQGVHLNFLLVSGLIWIAVTLESAGLHLVSVYTVLSHSTSLYLTVIDRFS